MRDPAEVLNEVSAAAGRGDSEALMGLVLELEGSVLTFSELPADFFSKLKALLADCAMLQLEDSWKLVYFVDSNWTLLTRRQRGELRDVLVSIFDKYQSHMGAFVISEILGRGYGGAEALGILMRLASSASGSAASLVPHGIEVLWRTSTDLALRERALASLRELAGCDVAAVRNEAAISLRKVGAG